MVDFGQGWGCRRGRCANKPSLQNKQLMKEKEKTSSYNLRMYNIVNVDTFDTVQQHIQILYIVLFRE